MTEIAPEDQEVAERATSRIPTFRSLEEAAEFWDTHDTTEFEDEFEEVTDVIFVPDQFENGVLVHLDEDALAALRVRANEQGIRPGALARIWILERLRESTSQQ